MILFIIGILIPSPTPTPEAPTATGTLKVAVFNDREDDITDTQILVDNKVVKHIPIYNGYWADFGSYGVTNGYKVMIKAICYNAVSGKRTAEMQKTVNASGSSNIGFLINEKGISVEKYPGVVLKPVPAEIPVEIPISSGNKPEDIIPLSVSGFKFVEKSEHVKPIFEGEEYSAYSFFKPKIDSTLIGKIDHLTIKIYKFKDETSAKETFLIFARLGISEEIQVDDTRAMLTYDKDSGETSVLWQEGKLVIMSISSPPFGASIFDEQVLKDAAITGAKAVAEKL